MNLKIGGSNVGKIMYNGQEFGNQKLEPGAILYLSVSKIAYNDELCGGNSTAEIIFPNVGKHWEGLKKIRIYIAYDSYVFDINSIDEPTKVPNGLITIHRERSLTDEPDKLIATRNDTYTQVILITAEE